MTTPFWPDRRLLIGLGAGTTLGAAGSRLLAAPPSRSAGPDSRALLDVNVRDFGAVGDGTTDDTAAFNRATDASAPWTPALERRIVVPPGRYRLAGTVYLRKGQELAGSGYATQFDARRVDDSTFVLGQAAGAAERDPGGSPVRIHGFRALGSAPRAPFIAVRAEGFSVENLFLTAVGTGLQIEGADGTIHNVIIDQALNGIVFRGAQNVLVSGLYTYLANYALTAVSDCHDIAVANSLFCYSRHAALLFAEGGSRLRGLSFTGCHFVQNEQFATFSGFVQSRASDVDALFSGCQFRNWPGFAIEQGAGRNIALGFTGCVFDGLATNGQYNQSTTAKVLTTGLAGRFRFDACEFRNLFGPIARLRAGGGDVAVTGGGAIDCRAPLFSVEDAGGRIAVSNLDNLLTVQGERRLLPTWPGAAWRISAVLALAGGGRQLVEEAIVSDDGGPALIIQRAFGAQPGALHLSLQAGPVRAVIIACDPARAKLLRVTANSVA